MKLIIWTSLALATLATGCSNITTPTLLPTAMTEAQTVTVAAVEHEHLIFTNGASLRTLHAYKYPVGAVLTNLSIDPVQGILERASVVIPAGHQAVGRCWFSKDLDLSTPNSAYCAEEY